MLNLRSQVESHTKQANEEAEEKQRAHSVRVCLCVE